MKTYEFRQTISLKRKQNQVVGRTAGLALWKSQTNRNVLSRAHEGNLGLALWKSQTNRNLMLYDDIGDTGLALWKSQTNRNPW